MNGKWNRVAILYKILVFIHIFSAIMGMGPGFVLTTVIKNAKTMTQLRHAYKIRNTLHIFVMVGGSLLLISGLSMGAINPSLFHMGWYVTSLILFLIALGMGPLVLAPRTRPIKELLKTYEGDDIPEEYNRLEKPFIRLEYVENIIFIIIISLMILKPF